MDFSRYPDKTYQLDWIRYYLERQAELNGRPSTSVTDRDVEECYVKTNKFALVSFFVYEACQGLSYANKQASAGNTLLIYT